MKIKNPEIKNDYFTAWKSLRKKMPPPTERHGRNKYKRERRDWKEIET